MARIRFFAAAADVLGTQETQLDANTLAQLRDHLLSDGSQSVEQVISRCSFLVDGRRTTDENTPLNSNSVVDVLPPFAGG